MNITDFADIHHHGAVEPDNEGNTIVNLSLPETDVVPETGFYSIGIHPWDTALYSPQLIEKLRLLAKRPNVVAIGEAGLDALRGGDIESQKEAFIAQSIVAEEVGKPLIIHAVRTLNDIIALHRRLKPKQQWIIHGFRGKPQLAEQLIKEGIGLSFGKHYNADSYAVTPASLRFHETDED